MVYIDRHSSRLLDMSVAMRQLGRIYPVMVGCTHIDVFVFGEYLVEVLQELY